MTIVARQRDDDGKNKKAFSGEEVKIESVFFKSRWYLSCIEIVYDEYKKRKYASANIENFDHKIEMHRNASKFQIKSRKR